MKESRLRSYVIFTTQRTGSTWLCDILYNHRNIKSYTELFRINPDVDYPRFGHTDVMLYERFLKSASLLDKLFFKEYLYREYLKKLTSKTETAHQCLSVGFKLMHSQEQRNKGLWKYLATNTDNFIHLKRRNLLDRAISKVYMESTGIAHANESDSDKESKPKGSLNVKKVLNELKKDTLESKAIAAKIATLPRDKFITIYYEDLDENLEATLKNLYTFLEVPFQVHSSSFRKLINETPREYVLNYDVIESTAANAGLLDRF